jgi:hypothetical protein
MTTPADISLIKLIAEHGGVKLRDIKVPNYAGDHPTRNKRVEKLWLTHDGAFIVPRCEVERLIASGGLGPLDNDPDSGIYVTPAQEREFEAEIEAHYEVVDAEFESANSTKH